MCEDRDIHDTSISVTDNGDAEEIEESHIRVSKAPMLHLPRRTPYTSLLQSSQPNASQQAAYARAEGLRA